MVDNWPELAIQWRNRYSGGGQPIDAECDELTFVGKTSFVWTLYSYIGSNVNCSIAGDPSTETGTVQGHDCAYYVCIPISKNCCRWQSLKVNGGGNGQGCGVLDSRTSSYGTGFNAIGGGVYAMQWTSDYIRVWFFPRQQIPTDILNLTPNPSNWGPPAANLQGSCNIDQSRVSEIYEHDVF